MFDLKNISISNKLYLSFFLITAFSGLYLLIGYPSLLNLYNLSSEVELMLTSANQIEGHLSSINKLEDAIKNYMTKPDKNNKLLILSKTEDLILSESTLKEVHSNDRISANSDYKIKYDRFVETLDELIESKEKENFRQMNICLVSVFEILKDVKKELKTTEFNIFSFIQNNVQRHNKILKSMAGSFIVVECFIIAFSIFLSFVLARFISVEIKKFQRVTKVIAEGNLDVDVDINSNDELGHLAEALNKMVSELKIKTTSVDRLNAEIEHRESIEKQLLKANINLRDVLENLDNSNRELRHLTHISAHDLREPLRKICCFAEMIKNDSGHLLSENDGENLNFIIVNGLSMLERIEAIRKYSQILIEPTSRSHADIPSIIYELIESNLRDNIENSQAQIGIVEPMPAVVCRKHHLKELFKNLITNSIQYHKKNEHPQITIKAKHYSNDMVRVEISDNGIGIKKQYFSNIFGMFRRLNVSAGYSGAGIGLAICRLIVNKYGGTIGVNSEYGKGTIFWFTLPLSVKEETDTPQLQTADINGISKS